MGIYKLFVYYEFVVVNGEQGFKRYKKRSILFAKSTGKCDRMFVGRGKRKSFKDMN